MTNMTHKKIQENLIDQTEPLDVNFTWKSSKLIFAQIQIYVDS